MSNQVYPTVSVMRTLKSRLHKAKDDIRQYMIQESIIDSSVKYADVDYQQSMDNNHIRRKQKDIIQLEFLIKQLQTIL